MSKPVVTTPTADQQIREINHVYYVEEDEHVVVVAVWGAIKGSGPDLTRLQ